jgi:hypothetical protein
MNKISKTTTISEFWLALQSAEDGLIRAAKILVKLSDENPNTYAEITKAYPQISYDTLFTLERVGRGQMYPALLCDTSVAARRIALLPFNQQKEIYENPVKVVTFSKGKKVVAEKLVQQLNPREVNLVFDDKRVRSVDEQMVELEILTQKHKPQSAQRYEILEDGSVVFLANTTLSAAQLEDVAERAKTKSIKSLGA